MATIWKDKEKRDRQELDAKKQELSELKEKNRILGAQIKHAFSPDGAITRKGLDFEMLRLDIVRRGENPLDQGAQSLIQGQQNEISYLLQMEATWLREKENILEDINDLEAATIALTERVQRRSKNNAT